SAPSRAGANAMSTCAKEPATPPPSCPCLRPCRSHPVPCCRPPCAPRRRAASPESRPPPPPSPRRSPPPSPRRAALPRSSTAATATAQARAARTAAHGGAALFIDYGHARSAPGDTLQALRPHRFADPFEAPGEADITAHVDFEELANAARRGGAAAHGPVEQGAFLKAL